MDKLDYVVGFAFSGHLDCVAMITKTKPEWQNGLLNGIGGKIEDGETPLQAMIREWDEECEILVDKDWKQFAVVAGRADNGKIWRVVFFHTKIMYGRGTVGYSMGKNYGKEEERIEIYSRQSLMDGAHEICIANIPMLLEAALCSMRFPKYKHLMIWEDEF